MGEKELEDLRPACGFFVAGGSCPKRATLFYVPRDGTRGGRSVTCAEHDLRRNAGPLSSVDRAYEKLTLAEYVVWCAMTR